MFLQEFLQSADQVKFARYIPDTGHAEAALTAVGNFLQQTREHERSGKLSGTESAHA